MTILTGRFDGKTVIFDEPVPLELPANTPVRVEFNLVRAETVLDRIAKLAGPSDLPADFSEQHDHCIKGTPRK